MTQVVCVAAILIGYSIVSFRTHPSVWNDASWGLAATIQFECGLSPSPVTARQPNPDDLATDIEIRHTWHPPGYQIVPYGFRVLGVSWGDAVRLTVLSMIFVGVSGWYLAFRQSGLSEPALGWLFIAFLFFRYTHAEIVHYTGGDLLLWALFPWAMVVNVAALGGRQAVALAAAAGAVTASLMWVRYLTGLLTFGLGLAWIVAVCLRWVPIRSLVAWASAAAVVFGLTMWAGFPGAWNSAGTISLAPPWPVGESFWHVTAWSLAISDLGSLLHYFFLHPAGQMLRPFHLIFFSFPLALLAAGVIKCRTAEDATSTARAYRLTAIIVTLAVAVQIAAMTFLNATLGFEIRYHRFSAILLLPLIACGSLRLFNSRSWACRVLGCGTIATFIVVPALYGFAAFAHKAVMRPQSRAIVSSKGLAYPQLGGSGDIRLMLSHLRDLGSHQSSVYYLPPPFLIEMVDRRCIMQTRFNTQQANGLPLVYCGVPPGGVILVFENSDEASGWPNQVKESFRDVEVWTRVTLHGTDRFHAWVGQRA